MSQDAIREALATAVQEVKQEDFKKPTLEKAPNDVVRKATELRWNPGLRDLALKMHMDGKNLTEIRQEIGKPAEEIVQVLGLDKVWCRRHVSKVWEQMIADYTEKGYSDSLIAEILNADGLRTAHGNLWTRKRIHYTRHRIKKSDQ